MTGFSGKKISLIILFAGAACLAAFVGLFLWMQSVSARIFEENGYVLEVAQDEEQLAAVAQHRFVIGESWQAKAGQVVQFAVENGSSVSVEDDSFIHYTSGNLAALTDSVIVDLEGYINGITNSYYMPAGSVYTFLGNAELIWKNSEQRFMLISEELEVTTASGAGFRSSSDYLELHYIEDDEVLQITDGENAWQVITKGCQIQLAKGIIFDCVTKELLTPKAVAERAKAESTAEWTEQTINLEDVEISSEGHSAMASAATPSVFRFFLTDGVSGKKGDDGDHGTEGSDGKPGLPGDAGSDGDAGGKGGAGSAGAMGAAGGIGIDGVDGTVIEGTDVQLGKPLILLKDWTLTDNSVSFIPYYDEVSFEAIEFIEDGQGQLSLYEVGKDNTPIKVMEELVVTDTPDAQNNKFVYEGLKPNTTYMVVYTDSYVLNGQPYENYRLLERIFTTSSSGLSVDLNTRTENSFSMGVNVAANDNGYIDIQKVEITYSIINEQNKKEEKKITINSTDADCNFSEILISGLKSNTSYPLSVDVTYKTKLDENNSSTSHTQHFDVTWTTLKKAPSLGGITLEAQKGLISATPLGLYDSTMSGSSLPYGQITDPDGALVSITYHLYDSAGTEVGTITRQDTKAAWFEVDGKNILTRTDYYVFAEYIWNNGGKDVKEILLETHPSKQSEALPSALLTLFTDHADRAWDKTTTVSGDGISISFSGNGTGVYNTTAKTNEGITYEAIRGALMVNLNGTSLSVSNNHKLTVTFEDHLAYRRVLEYTNCEGKQGNIEGTFALPLDVDGLLKNNSYVVTLEGYEYTKATDTYTKKELGTIVLRTAQEADITIGMNIAPSGVGARFFLGAATYDEVITKENHYLGNGNYAAEYMAETPASYRNLDHLIFSLYAVQGDTLLGTCDVEIKDAQGNKADYAYDQSPLYQNFYGDAVEDTATETKTLNYVGVGSTFAYQFYDSNGIALSESMLSNYAGGFYIKVKAAYDYTYVRYRNSENYDYFVFDNNPEEKDLVNEITINGGAGYTLTGLTYQARPISPDSSDVIDPNTKIAINVSQLENSSYGSLNGRDDLAEKYDESLDNDTVVGLRLTTQYYDRNKITKTATFYGFTYETYTKDWEGSDSLTDVSAMLPFKFTFHMTNDQQPYVDKTTALDRMPAIYLMMYDPNDPVMTDEYMIENGFKECPATDRGYYYYKYDSSRGYVIYTDFISRGTTYMFAYDAIMAYSMNNKEEFSFPEDYMYNFMMNGSYTKQDTLRSATVSLHRQEPRVNAQLIDRVFHIDTENANNTTLDEKWQIYLFDPDHAVKPEFFLGSGEGWGHHGGLYNGTTQWDGMQVTGTQANGTQANGKKITLGFAGVKSMQYTAGTTVGDFNVTMTDTSDASLDRDAQIEKMTNLLEAMRSHTPATDSTEESFGTELTIQNIVSTGGYYSLRMVYRTLDDMTNNYNEYYDTTITMLAHQAAGYADKNGLKLETKLDEVTGNDVYVEFKDSANFAKMVSKVLVTAKKVNEDGSKTPIYVNPNVSDDEKQVKVLTCYPTKGDPDYIKFGLNELSRMSSDEESSTTTQFTTGDTLEFEYTLYYHDGTTQVMGDDGLALPETEAEAEALGENGIYAVKNFLRDSYVSYFRISDRYNKVESYGNNGTIATHSIMYAYGYDRTYDTTTGHNGTVYQGNLTESYNVRSLYYNNSTSFELTAGLYYRNDDSTGGYGETVTGIYELHKIQTYAVKQENLENGEARITIGTVAPSATKVSAYPGIQRASLTITMENYNLMDYPGDDETFHLYYLLERYDSSSGEWVYVGAQIGETEGVLSVDGIGHVMMDNMETGNKYRVYLFYKDCRAFPAGEGTTNFTDDKIFGANYTRGQWYLGNTAIRNTILSTSYIKPLATNLSNVKKDNAGNVYVEFELTSGLNLQSISGTFDFTDEMIDFQYDSTLPGYVAIPGRTLSMTTRCNVKEDDNTVMMSIIERRKIGDNTWYTILAPEAFYGIMLDEDNQDLDNYCTNLLEGAVDETTGEVADQYCLESYGAAYQAPELALSGSNGYAGVLKLTYYPGKDALIKPGYAYRVRSVVYQYQSDGSAELISQRYEGSDQRYICSTAYEWQQAEYAEDIPMVSIQKIANQTSFKLNILANNNKAYVFSRVYARLFEKQDGSWVQVESNLDGEGFVVGQTRNLTIQKENENQAVELTPGAEYQVRFYSLMDLDFDNRVDVAGNAGPLSENSGDVLYTGIDDYGRLQKPAQGEEALTEAVPQLNALYVKYFGMLESEAGYFWKAVTVDENLLITTTETIKTLTGIGTLGTGALAMPHARDNTTIVIYLKEASNLNKLETVQYTINYMDENGVYVGSYSGETQWKSTTVDGDISLSVTSANLNNTRKGTYLIQLHANFKDGDVKQTEQLEPITMVVD